MKNKNCRKLRYFLVFTAATKSFMPFVSLVPTELKEEFTNDMAKLALSYNSDSMPKDVAVEMPFQCLLAYARKKC